MLLECEHLTNVILIQQRIFPWKYIICVSYNIITYIISHKYITYYIICDWGEQFWLFKLLIKKFEDRFHFPRETGLQNEVPAKTVLSEMAPFYKRLSDTINQYVI